jgi:hypothetical protein
LYLFYFFNANKNLITQFFLLFRFKKKNILITTIIPGPKKPYNMHSFLFPTYQELLRLEKKGMLVRFSNGEQITFTTTLAVVIGDIPACADLCGHMGHQSYYGCRMCGIKATRYKASMCYKPQQHENPADLMREIEDFIQGDKVSS